MTSPTSKRIRTIFALVIALFSVAAFALVIGKDSTSGDWKGFNLVRFWG